MILFIGQVERAAMEREAFQEIDFRPHVRTNGKVGRPD